jgi:glycine/D-amino acid oxidase-like deaminating enzyme
MMNFVLKASSVRLPRKLTQFQVDVAHVPRSQYLPLICRRSFSQKTELVIIGCGAVGLPASFLTTKRNIEFVVIDGGTAALDSSTHTVHTSIARPNWAVWPFSKALDSWLNSGPFDVRLSNLESINFYIHSFLQSYLVSQARKQEMWEVMRRVGIESSHLYAEMSEDLGPLEVGSKGRGHLSSPHILDDKATVLGLQQKLSALGVPSHIVENAGEIQGYVGRLRVRAPELMAFYPEDFVLDLNRYKDLVVDAAQKNGGTFLRDTVIALERDRKGRVIAVKTEGGQRLETDAVLYAGGWNSGQFLKSWLGLDLKSHLNVASGVRFKLKGHLVERSIVCGPMFLAPGRDRDGTAVTDIGQMFLTAYTNPRPEKKHLEQAVERFRVYFDCSDEITNIWNCVGRPITTTGIPIIERVAPNMVVALGAGMFGVSIGPVLAKRGLDLLLSGQEHPDSLYFQRQTAYEIMQMFMKDRFSSTSFRISEIRTLPKTPQLIQIARRGAMAKELQKAFKGPNYTIYGASELQNILQDLKSRPANSAVLLIASHGPHAKLPSHYDENYISADQAVKAVLSESCSKSLLGIVVISGGIDEKTAKEMMGLAGAKGVRFIYLPSLATSMNLILKIFNSLVSSLSPPTQLLIEDSFHKGKKDIPSASASQALVMVIKQFGMQHLFLTVTNGILEEALRSQHPGLTIVKATDEDRVQSLMNSQEDFVRLHMNSYRNGESYQFAHRLAIKENELTVTLEQSLTERSSLVKPIQTALEKLPSLPVDFASVGFDSLLSTSSLKAGTSLWTVLDVILQELYAKRFIMSIEVGPGSDLILERILRFPAGLPEDLVIRHVPSSTSTVKVKGKCEGQEFSITIAMKT